MGEACFLCVKGEDGKVQLKTLSRLDKPQYDLPAYKGVFTDEEKQKLQDTGTLGGIKEMKDTYTGKVCNCYVAFHEPSNRIITMPVDAIKIPDYIYGKRLDDKQKQVLASGGQLSINDIQRKNASFRRGLCRSENHGYRIQAGQRTAESERHHHGSQNHPRTEKDAGKP